MAEPVRFKVGEAPWEKGEAKTSQPQTFKVGEAPWEKMPGGGTGGGFVDSLVEAARTIDSYTGAPTRAAIGAAQNAKNPLTAFGSQWGEDPDKAPTGQALVEKAGVSRRPIYDVSDDQFDFLEATNPMAARDREGLRHITKSGAAGFAMDAAADWTNAVPFKKVADGLGVVSKGLANTAATTAKAAAKEVPGAKAIQVAVDAAKESAGHTADALKRMFAPSRAHDFEELVSIAQKNGIDPRILPEAVEFGEGSFIARASRHRAEGVLGEPHLKKFQEGLEAVRDATERKIAEIGGGHVPNAIEAGEIIRHGYDQGVDSVLNSVGMTHNKIVKAYPGLQVTPEASEKILDKLATLEKWASDKAVRGFTAAQRTQAEQVRRAVQAVIEGNGSYAHTLETLRDIGDVAFKSKNIAADVPPDIQKFRDLYFTISDALHDTVRATVGSEVADDLVKSNKVITDLFGDKSTIGHIVGNKSMAPERVFAALIEQGDTNKIKALKRILPPETFQKLKGAFLDSQIRRSADDSFTFKSLQNNLRNKKNVLGELLDPHEIDSLSELIRLGDRFGNPVLSTSGTGASNVFRDIGEGLRSGVENDTVIGLLKDSARRRSEQAAKVVGAANNGNPLIPGAVSAAGEAAAEEAATQAPSLIKRAQEGLKRAGAVTPAATRPFSTHSKEQQEDQEAPGGGSRSLRGEEKWASAGLERVLNEDSSLQSLRGDMLANPTVKTLLMQASDLRPGSRALQLKVQQIRTEIGKQRG